MSPSAKFIHQATCAELMAIFRDRLNQNKCKCIAISKLDLHLSNHTVVRPDVMIICGQTDLYYPTKAALVVEVLSKNTKMKNLNTKFALYEEAKIPYYIIIDTDSENLKTYKLKGSAYKLVKNTGAFYFPDCTVDVEWSTLWEWAQLFFIAKYTPLVQPKPS